MKYLPTKFELDWWYSFWVIRAKRCTDRQTDWQKQTDYNNPLLSSSVNKTLLYCITAMTSTKCRSFWFHTQNSKVRYITVCYLIWLIVLRIPVALNFCFKQNLALLVQYTFQPVNHNTLFGRLSNCLFINIATWLREVWILALLCIDIKLYLFSRPKSGSQISCGGTMILERFPYSELFHTRNSSVQCYKTR